MTLQSEQVSAVVDRGICYFGRNWLACVITH
jgi:hypothetical protein